MTSRIRTRLTHLASSASTGAILAAILLVPAAPGLATAKQPPLALHASSVGGSPLAQVDRIFEDFTGLDRPGCAVGVTRHGRTVLTRAYGMADLEHSVPNTPSTIFEAGSVSKQFTAGAVILLALEGAFSLEDDIRDFIPEVPDYGETITIRHLLNHTSGLRDWGAVAALSGWGRSARTHDHGHVLEIVSRQSALNYSPGAAYSYTNTGYNLLALLVERTSGTSFSKFSEERIFQPLGLANTQWRDDYRRIVPGRSSAYSTRGGTYFIDRPIEDVHGNGGLLTTVEDLLRWDEALRTGTFGGPGFIEEMHRQGILNDGRTIEYASGVQVGSHRGVPSVTHTGATSGYRAFLGRYPDQELSVALLCNVSSANPGGLGTRVVNVFLGDLSDPPTPVRLAPARISPASLASRAGLYREVGNGEPLSLVVDGGELRLTDGPVLRPVSETEFEIGSGDRHLTFPLGAATLEERRGGTLVSTFLRVEPAAPSAAELLSFVGVYHSEDAETTLTLALDEGGLVLARPPGGARIPLAPLYADAFRSPWGLVRFHRDEAGNITEFGLRQARVHDMRFQRRDREGGR